MALYRPKINAVTITPNPVNINAQFLIAISVEEVEIIMYKVSPLSGTFKLGQTVLLDVDKEVE